MEELAAMEEATKATRNPEAGELASDGNANRCRRKREHTHGPDATPA